MKYSGLLSAVAVTLLATPSIATQCPPKVVSLATGIYLNIIGQHGELNATKNLQAVEASPQPPTYFAQFEEGKGELLSDIASGINIRKYNQAIIPPGNAATAGLNQYAAAQGTEQSLAQSLNGIPSHDKPILDTLVGDIKNGTALNERNLKDATQGCELGFTFPKID